MLWSTATSLLTRAAVVAVTQFAWLVGGIALLQGCTRHTPDDVGAIRRRNSAVHLPVA